MVRNRESVMTNNGKHRHRSSKWQPIPVLAAWFGSDLYSWIRPSGTHDRNDRSSSSLEEAWPVMKLSLDGHRSGARPLSPDAEKTKNHGCPRGSSRAIHKSRLVTKDRKGMRNNITLSIADFTLVSPSSHSRVDGATRFRRRAWAFSRSALSNSGRPCCSQNWARLRYHRGSSGAKRIDSP